MEIKEIQHLEELSNLKLSSQQRERFAQDLDNIIQFASQISKETHQAQGFIQSIHFKELREDIVQPSLPQEKVVINAPDQRKGCFAVPRIME